MKKLLLTKWIVICMLCISIIMPHNICLADEIFQEDSVKALEELHSKNTKEIIESTTKVVDQSSILKKRDSLLDLVQIDDEKYLDFY